MTNCPLCGRPLIDGPSIDEHHLKPKAFGVKKEVTDTSNRIVLHKICHLKIHSSISERELESYYHTIERLLEHEDIQKFIKWVQKKDPEFVNIHRDTKERKRRRKR